MRGAETKEATPPSSIAMMIYVLCDQLRLGALALSVCSHVEQRKAQAFEDTPSSLALVAPILYVLLEQP